MGNDIILSIYCNLKEGLPPDKYEDLWKMAESLKTKVEDSSDFIMSWGPKISNAQHLSFFLKRNIHKTEYEVSEAKRIADTMLDKIKTVIANINICESTITSDFSLDESNLSSEEGLYYYSLSEELSLNIPNS